MRPTLAVCVPLFLVFAASASAAKSCLNPERHVPSDNYCVGEYDPATGDKTPNCVNRGTQIAPDWRCARCAVNCDCPVGQYCVRTPGADAGDCETLESTGKIGETCTAFGLVGATGARVPVRGVDDGSLCGSAIYDERTGAFASYEWLGSCVQGKCSECAGDAVSWSIAITAQIVPGLAGASREGNMTGAWDGGSLVCDGRVCDRGVLVAQPPWFWDYFPTGAITALVVFVILIFAVLFIWFAMECCCCCAKNKGKLLKSSRHGDKVASGSGADGKSSEMAKFVIEDPENKEP